MKKIISVLFVVIPLINIKADIPESLIVDIKETITKMEKSINSPQYDISYRKMIQCDERYSSIIENKIVKGELGQLKPFSKSEDSYQRERIELNNISKIKTYYWVFPQINQDIYIYANYYPIVSPYTKTQISYPFLIHLVILDKNRNITFRSVLPSPFKGKNVWFFSTTYVPYFLGQTEKEGTLIPDIFLLFGPDGSGNFISVFRFQYILEKESWESELIIKESVRGNIYIAREVLILKINDNEINLKTCKYLP